MSESIDRLIVSISAELIRRGEMICAAESCTGGLIAKSFTDLAGSSAWFERGFVTYSNQAKIDMLGVDPQTLLEHGAVSEQTAGEMVKGALAHSRARVAVAVTGIAGPSGGTADKPVGTVWFGFAVGDRLLTIKQKFDGDRTQVREASLLFALEQIDLLLAADD